ncbi:alpha/beta fold hydrolase [Sediminicola luteus]|uniref:AB hydrolase-1 domain-containing protein n=1 Tax=Sediminicola luteus TaxID=319238 RepID=A0A2A4GDK7_9FLAO|nr:alpha/beta hydrolase [Sediminicola luteus]PCE66677.1 hypothetical protein B7P33_05130 [Sediminicola luteus]
MKIGRKRDGDKGTLIMIHGNSSSSAIFEPVFEEHTLLVEKVTVGLPGHAKTPWPPHSFQGLVQDLVQLFHQCTGPVFVLGHSLGGHIAIELLSKKVPLAGLILCGTPPLTKPYNFEAGFLPVAETQTYFTVHPTVDAIAVLAQKITLDPIVRQQIIKDFNQTDPLFRAALLTSFETGFWSDQFALFTKADCPRLLIVGEQDLLVNPAYIEQVCAQAGENCNLVNIDEGGHFLPLENPTAFTKELTRFISENL